MRPKSEATVIRNLLLRVLDSGFDKSAWHGPNLWSAVARVNVAQAMWRIEGRKTIWQQALHAAYWKHRVASRLAGRQRFGRSPANWPDMPLEPTPTAWKADLALLAQTHRRLREAVEQLPADRLQELKLQHMIHGIAAHDVYHAGQIRLLWQMASAAGV